MKKEIEIDAFIGSRGASLKGTSRTAYKNALMKCYTALGIKSIREFEDTHMSELRDKLDVIYKSKTRELALRVFKMFIRYSVRHGWSTIDPEEIIIKHGIADLKEPPENMEYLALLEALSPRQYACRISKIRSLQQMLIVRVLHDTGMRLNELTSLTIDSVKSSLMGIGHCTILTEKADQYRTVFWGHQTQKVMSEYLKWRSEVDTDSDKLFIGIRKDGKLEQSLSGRTIQRMIEDGCKTAKIRILTPHLFRHGFIHCRIEEGMPLTDIIQFTGHSNIEALKNYTRRSVDRKAKMAAIFLKSPYLVEVKSDIVVSKKIARKYIAGKV